MKSIFAIVAAAALALIPVTASADEAAATSMAAPQAAVAPAADALGTLPKAVSLSELSSMSGGASPIVTVSSQTLSATNSGNSVTADSVVTGNVALAPGTFNGFNGVGNFVFNTGNNNNVQGTLSVTVVAPSIP